MTVCIESFHTFPFNNFYMLLTVLALTESLSQAKSISAAVTVWCCPLSKMATTAITPRKRLLLLIVLLYHLPPPSIALLIPPLPSEG